MNQDHFRKTIRDIAIDGLSHDQQTTLLQFMPVVGEILRERDEKLLSLREASEPGHFEKTLCRMRKRGRIRDVHIGSRCRIPLSEIEAIKSGTAEREER